MRLFRRPSARPRSRRIHVLFAVVALVAAAGSITEHPAAASADARPYGRFGAPLAIDMHSTARQQLASGDLLTASSRSAAAVIARYPSANWIGGQGPADAEDLVARITASAAQQRSLAQLVLFDLPNRTCGRNDGFIPTSATSYRAWVRGVVRGLGRHRAIVVVEPDSVAMASCLPKQERQERYDLVRYAVDHVRAQGSWAYIDIGHSKWLDVRTAVARLKATGIRRASGFSLNVSNFRTDAELIRYGTAISKQVGGRHFVIDSSRNGVAPKNAAWCNPSGKGLGHAPTTRTGVRRLDAYLWIKNPGGSDGTCDGGPAPGSWYPGYASMLVRNARLR